MQRAGHSFAAHLDNWGDTIGLRTASPQFIGAKLRPLQEVRAERASQLYRARLNQALHSGPSHSDGPKQKVPVQDQVGAKSVWHELRIRIPSRYALPHSTELMRNGRRSRTRAGLVAQRLTVPFPRPSRDFPRDDNGRLPPRQLR